MGKTSLLAPGFRFHPTDVELVMYYLKRKVMGKRLHFEAIAEVDLYKFAPWDLPDKSLLKGGDMKWYFFCQVEKKYSCGARMNRATEFGYWKTTGKDRPIHYNKELVGSIKTLIFHRGKAPRGERTDWVMHEYKLEDKHLARKGVVQNTYVLSMIFQKEGMGPRNGAQYGALFKEEDWNDDEQVDCVETVPSADLLTPTYVLPTNHSNSVAIGTSFLGGTVSESCLSETMPTCCERLPTRCSSDVIYQASGDSDILPEVLAETVPSSDWLTPTYVLPTNHSNSVAIGTSFLGGTVSESCLSETMPTCCERLPTRCSSDVIYQASGDSDILPEVLAETVPSSDLLTPTYVLPTNHSNSVAIGTSFLGGTVSESCLSETMPNCCERLPTHCSSDVVYQASGDSDILPEVLPNSVDDILPLLSSFTEDNTLISIEDDQNKNLNHGNAEPALYFDADNFHQDSRDPGNTAGLSEDGYSFYDGQEVHLDHYFRTSDFLQPLDIFRNWG